MQAKRRKLGRPPKTEKVPETIERLSVAMIGSREWFDWLDSIGRKLGNASGVTMNFKRTMVVDAALNLLAKTLNLPEPPKR